MVDLRLHKTNPCVIRVYRDKFVTTPYMELIFDKPYVNYHSLSPFIDLWSYSVQYLLEL